MHRVILLCFLLYCFTATAQDYRAKLHVKTTDDYKAQVRTDSSVRLLELIKAIPDIKLDIKYATASNFMEQRMYSQARAFARAEVVEALKEVQRELRKQGLGLKIFDAYRPYTVTVDFYNKAKDSTFVASPRTGSKHNRGCAIDLTIIDLKAGKELNMPTAFDSFSPQASANYEGLSGPALQNRELLRGVMEAHGFTVYPAEWWHFDYNGWQKYDLLDVPFEAL